MTALLESGIDIGARNERAGTNNGPYSYYCAAFIGLDVDWPYSLPFSVRLFLKCAAGSRRALRVRGNGRQHQGHNYGRN
jgi:hypothetical protein